MEQSLSDRLREFRWKVGDYLKTGAKVAVGGLIFYSLASHNGMLDSNRTREARGYSNASNPIKTVATVKERLEDNVVYSPTLDGYNPKVIREVTFEDGSETRLEYRTLAWQPFRKWLGGEEFNPHPSEKYEVTSRNMIVRKVE